VAFLLNGIKKTCQDYLLPSQESKLKFYKYDLGSLITKQPRWVIDNTNNYFLALNILQSPNLYTCLRGGYFLGILYVSTWDLFSILFSSLKRKTIFQINRTRSRQWQRHFLLSKNSQTVPGTHLAFYSMGTEVLSRG
jgi:hypothetical protein